MVGKYDISYYDTFHLNEISKTKNKVGIVGKLIKAFAW